MRVKERKTASLFVGEVDKAKSIRGLTNADIAEMTGYSKSTIDAFMSGFRDSDAIKSAISKALDIEM